MRAWCRIAASDGRLMSVAIPHTIEAVTPGWLTEALHESGALGDSTSVASVEAETVGTGVGILGLLARLTLTYGGEATEFPTTMVVKIASPHPETKDIARFYGFYATEVGCYRAAIAWPPFLQETRDRS